MIKVVWQLAESNAIHDRELKEQEDAIKKIRAVNDKYTEETGKKKKYFRGSMRISSSCLSLF